MRPGQSFVSFILLFVFSTLLLKTAFVSGAPTDCHEFAHIHEFKIEKIFQKFSDKISVRAQTADDECHGAQAIFGAALMFVRPVIVVNAMRTFSFEYSLKNETQLPSPDLQTLRRPPRTNI